jgi:rhodanese-related sulfurtransferase
MSDSEAAREPDEVERLLAEHPQVRVLDVRSAESRDNGAKIPGSELLPVNADLAAGEMDVLLAQGLPTDTPLVFVCNSGGKCTRAAEHLRSLGYDAISVRGGMRAWTEAGKDVEQ